MLIVADYLTQMIILFVFAGGVIAFFWFAFFRNKASGKVSDFKEQETKKTIIDELKPKLDNQGIRLKNWKLIKNLNEIGTLDRAMYFNVKMPKYIIKPKDRRFINVLDDEIETLFLLVRCISKSLLKRIFGIGKIHYMFEISGDYKKLFEVNIINKFIHIKQNVDITKWLDIWVMSESAIEYLSNISIKRLFEQDLMHSENMADRAVHFDISQAKTERMQRIINDLEKGKYEDRKNMGDSTIL